MLRRELGLMDAVMMGLGSILGTGIFVSIGLAAGIAGPAVIVALALAAVLAAFNALSSAQLAAAHPVSGGTYEYGYEFLRPSLGFTAGWMFVLAKSASAATAALGFAGYLTASTGLFAGGRPVVACVTVALLTGVVLSGMRRSSRLNIAIVAITLLSLIAFTLAGLGVQAARGGTEFYTPFFAGDGAGEVAANLLHACALMFVAYTGYGRIATLAEEVADPQRTIPRAIIATLLVAGVIYVGVAAAGVGSVGSAFLQRAAAGEAAPLALAARRFGIPLLPALVAVGAATAMLGVLLNLLLGLSRVLLAMGRRGDAPRALARLDRSGATPVAAVIAVGGLIAGLTLIGSVRTTWSFSAFTVLIYYAITNAAALALPPPARLFPRWMAAAGLAGCLFLAFWVEQRIWLSGLLLIAAGLGWHRLARRLPR
ncbi:MAG TPA: APC family permease [Candidatus Sumerlaeota bacterium]|nr:APC family permease [Candidatus Sumerlaeota bacterium]HOR26763.1 APC family permease [Candidatus Sumerlaeota bacterium]HPK01810.1 APC family permease [Candidatus Sumerlaeota bacterium]